MNDEKNKYVSSLYSKWNYKLDKIFYGVSAKERLLWLLANSASAFCAFILTLGNLPFTDKVIGFPVSEAFVFASGQFSIGAFIGLFYGYYRYGGVLSLYISLSAVIAVRLAVSKYMSSKNGTVFLSDPSLIRLSMCALLPMLRTVMRLTEGGYTSDMWSSLSFTLVYAPALCAVLLLYFSEFPEKNVLRRVLYYSAMSLFFALIVYSSANIRYAGGNIGVICAIFLTLSVSRYSGAVPGALIGLLLGYISAPQNAIPTSLIGLVSGIFFSLGALTCTGFSVAAGAISSFLLNGIGSLASFVPEAIISVAITSPALKYNFLPKNFPFPHSSTCASAISASDRLSDKLSTDSSHASLLKLSDTFSELSRSVSNPSDGTSTRICDDLKENFCESCPMSPICWENEKNDANSSLTKLAELYLSGKNDIRESIPSWLSERCIKLKGICKETERLCFNSKKSICSKKRPALADELLNISEILSDVATEIEDKNRKNRDDEIKLLRKLSSLGYRTDGVAVLGNSRKTVHIYGIGSEKSEDESKKLQVAVSDACEKNFSFPIFINGNAILTSALKFTAESHDASETKAGEPCSGDCVFSFTTDDGCYYSVLTDGMGSGTEAAECSRYASEVLEKLIRSNVRRSVAVRILGDMLRARFKECFTTVDIMKLDLVSGRTDFLKSGAASSYILRGSSVYCINSKTMPIGITSDTSPEELDFELKDGDTVVMMSDGVASDPEDSDWLAKVLASGELKTPSALATELISNAIKFRGRSDDMTVSVTKIRAVS